MYLKPLHKFDKFLYKNKEVIIYNVPTINWWWVTYMYEDEKRKDNSLMGFAWWPKFICKAKKI